MKYFVSLLLIVILAGCTSRVRHTSSTDCRVSFDPFASFMGTGVSGKQVVPMENQTSVNADNTRGWKGGKF